MSEEGVESAFTGFIFPATVTGGYPTTKPQAAPIKEQPKASVQERAQECTLQYLKIFAQEQINAQEGGRKAFTAHIMPPGGSPTWRVTIASFILKYLPRLLGISKVASFVSNTITEIKVVKTAAASATNSTTKLIDSASEAVKNFEAAQQKYIKFVTQDSIRVRAGFLGSAFKMESDQEKYLEGSAGLRDAINGHLGVLRKDLEKAAGALQKEHADLKAKITKNDTSSEAYKQLKQLESEIERMSTQAAHLDSALSSVKVQEYKLATLEACLARRQVQGNFNLNPKDKEDVTLLKSEIIQAELSEVIKSAENQPAFLTQQEVKAQMDDFKKKYKWGATVEHENAARVAPHNWANSARVDFKYSQSGALHATVILHEPELVLEHPITGVKLGVPAGARKLHAKEPTNLVKTTRYFLSNEGEPDKKDIRVSWRGGQFPTVEAAKKALKAMGEPNEEGRPLHINSLLTPSWLARYVKGGEPDIELLEAHRKNLEEAYRALGGEVQNLIISNFGVNEGATRGEKVAGIMKTSVGHHASFKACTNKALEQLDAQMRAFIARATGKDDKGNKIPIDPEAAAIYPEVMRLHADLREVIGKNQYMDAEQGGLGQFKAPALWGALDALIGGVTYTNCMSGKDRTGAVEGSGERISEELLMMSRERRNKTGYQPDTRGYTYTKIEPKAISYSSAFRETSGLSEQQMPLDNYLRRSSVTKYVEFDPVVLDLGTRISRPFLFIEKQYAAKNAEQSFLANINRVTAMNTGVAGSKAILGYPMWEVCGFSRSYVTAQILNNKDEDEVSQDLGLDRLSPKEKAHFMNRLRQINSIELENIKAPIIETFLEDVAKAKMKAVMPPVSVAS